MIDISTNVSSSTIHFQEECLAIAYWMTRFPTVFKYRISWLEFENASTELRIAFTSVPALVIYSQPIRKFFRAHCVYFTQSSQSSWALTSNIHSYTTRLHTYTIECTVEVNKLLTMTAFCSNFLFSLMSFLYEVVGRYTICRLAKLYVKM